MFGNFDKIFYGPRRLTPAVIPCLLGTGPLRTPGKLFRASHDHSMEGAPLAARAYLWCPEAESNHRHEDFQSSALPTELSGHK